MKLCARFFVCVAGVLVLLCCSCETTNQAPDNPGDMVVLAAPEPVETSPAKAEAPKPAPPEVVAVVEQGPAPAVPTQPEANKPAPVKPEAPAPQPNDVVAQIGSYVITRAEFEARLLKELRGDPDREIIEVEPVDPNKLLLTMLGDKAMVMAGRDAKILEGDRSFKDYRDGKLASFVLQKSLPERIDVNDSEIDARIKADPKLTREQAEAAVQQEKAAKIVDEFYEHLVKKLNVEKLRYNFPKAAQIHQRLLYQPAKPRQQWWIVRTQIEEELTPEEKGIVLVKFEGGEVTLEDWFYVIHGIVPTRRPQNLGTMEGVEALLERTMRVPIFVAEAKLRGLDKDEDFLSQIRRYEEVMLLERIRTKATGSVPRDFTEQEVADYFNKHREEFHSPDKLKIDQIWCEDLETAEKAKEALNQGLDIGAVRQQYSLTKDGASVETSPAEEQVFFAQLWKGEPNQIIGPLKGFYNDALKWRVVRIVQKNPGALKEFSSALAAEVKGKIRSNLREEAIDTFRQQQLEKYLHKIYWERIRDIDPLSKK